MDAVHAAYNQWRVDAAKAELEKFLKLTYDPDTSGDSRMQHAMFTLGGVTALLAMSDEAVAQRMAETAS